MSKNSQWPIVVQFTDTKEFQKVVSPQDFLKLPIERYFRIVQRND